MEEDQGLGELPPLCQERGYAVDDDPLCAFSDILPPLPGEGEADGLEPLQQQVQEPQPGRQEWDPGSGDAAWQQQHHEPSPGPVSPEELHLHRTDDAAWALHKQQAEAEHAERVQGLAAALQLERERLAYEQQLLQPLQAARLGVLQHRRAFLDRLLHHQRAPGTPRGASALLLKRREKRNTHVKAWHVKESKRASREAGQRIQALKDQDYEQYLRLATRAKDQRLRDLMEKTDSIVAELGHKVADQRALGAGSKLSAEAESAWLEDLEPAMQQPGEAGTSAAARGMIDQQRRYYAQVHRVKEQVEVPALVRGGELRSYQVSGLKFLVSLHNNHMNGILADEMGLGKTIQAIAYLAHLLECKGNRGPHLILAPKAVLPNWAAEFVKWAPAMTAVLYDGTPDERRALAARHLSSKGALHVLITHYDLVLKDRTVLKRVSWEQLIVDEGHRLKNAESKLAEILRTFRCRARLLLTGTPIQNNLRELWSLLNFVLPHVFSSEASFDEWFAAPFQGRTEDVAGRLNEEEELLVITRLHQVLRPFMLRRTKREVEQELPAKMERTLKCALSAWQAVLYRQITQEGRIASDAKPRSLQNTAMQLRKVCNHPYLFLERVAYVPADPAEVVRASGKLAVLDNILPKLQATGHRVLLFSQMTRSLDIIEDYLMLHGFQFLRLDGATKSENRVGLLEEFNQEDSPIFVFMLSTRAGGLGLNLQSADTVIMFDSDWNPSADRQAEDRAHRIGQKKDVLVLVLVTGGTIEEVILERAGQKRDLDAKAIQAGMFNDKSTHHERQQVLQTIMRKGATAVGVAGHTGHDINQMLARGKEEVVVFEQMDAERCPKGEPAVRLMEMQEVPKWVLQPTATKREQQMADVEIVSLRKKGGRGRGKRRGSGRGSAAPKRQRRAPSAARLEASESETGSEDESVAAEAAEGTPEAQTAVRRSRRARAVRNWGDAGDSPVPEAVASEVDYESERGGAAAGNRARSTSSSRQ